MIYLVSDWETAEATAGQNFTISNCINNCDTNNESVLTGTRSLDLTKQMLFKYPNICFKTCKASV